MADLMCVVNSYPVPIIKWKFVGGQNSGAEVTNGLNGFRIQVENGEFGASSKLSVQVTDQLQGTQYKCEATN